MAASSQSRLPERRRAHGLAEAAHSGIQVLVVGGAPATIGYLIGSLMPD